MTPFLIGRLHTENGNSHLTTKNNGAFVHTGHVHSTSTVTGRRSPLPPSLPPQWRKHTCACPQAYIPLISTAVPVFKPREQDELSCTIRCALHIRKYICIPLLPLSKLHQLKGYFCLHDGRSDPYNPRKDVQRRKAGVMYTTQTHAPPARFANIANVRLSC